MRKTFSFIAVFIVIMTALSSCRRLNQRLGVGDAHQVLVSKSEYPASEIKQVIASTSGGNIEVIGDATGQATLEIFASYKSSDSTTIVAKMNEYYNLSISHDNSILTVRSERKKSVNSVFSNNSGVSVSFKIHVSQQVANELKTSGGNILIKQFVGNQKLNTSGGNIQLENIQGDIDGHTSGGNIDGESLTGTNNLETSGGNISIAKGKGNMSLETSGGNVSVRDAEGALKLSTSGGNIEALNIIGGLNGSTSGGNIDVKFAQVNSNIDLDNSGGDIHLVIPKDSKANLDIASDNVNVSGLNNFSGKSDKHTVDGTLNGGGPVVKARTSGGTIHLDSE